MVRRQKHLVTLAGDDTVSFMTVHNGGPAKAPVNLPLDSFLEGAEEPSALPRTVLQSANRLLVVPDHWMGSTFHDFQSRKKSVVCAFIERKLRAEQPGLSDCGNFYDYAFVSGQDRQPQLYTIFLQEAVAYRLYRRLEQLDLSPTRITTPALLWQARLKDLDSGFGQSGVGLIHRLDAECYLYFFFMGQFLFSRTIKLQESGQAKGETDALLNYEINQSFYLFSQKTKSAVDHLYLLTPEPGERSRLTDLLGREVKQLPGMSPQPVLVEDGSIPPSFRVFSVQDLFRTDTLAISYKPLKKELFWQPVQWAGIAVGLIVAVLLTVETLYLNSWSAVVDRQMAEPVSTDAQPPGSVLQEISMAVEAVGQALQRPSGSDAALKAFLAAPDSLSVTHVSMDVSETPRLTISAVIKAGDPDRVKAVMKRFLDRMNARFDLKSGSLQEKDVTIGLDRKEEKEMTPVYQINFGFELPR